MTAISWDEVGDRLYHTGVDRGVLYAHGHAIPWNGLISVDEDNDGGAVTSHYFEGVKYADLIQPETYKATIKAYTYPDEFEQFNGVEDITPGFMATAQPRSTFGLSYRTMIGNDLKENLGYRLHLVYNLTVIPAQISFESLSDSPSAVEFSWDVVGIPVRVSGKRPTAHLIIDSRDYPADALAAVEVLLYGDATTDGSLPLPSEILATAASYYLTITDNGDGTWTASGPDVYFAVNSGGEFELVSVNGGYFDSETYQIRSTNE